MSRLDFLLRFLLKKEARRLKRIKESTEVNELYIEQHKRISRERHERLRQRIKDELFENKNINYQKHMREF